ncbi:MAG: hypothetical protein KBS45_02055 [Clostridiales bacterium]|nr:hypothetical protein [Candidatus Coliplasma caballi]
MDVRRFETVLHEYLERAPKLAGIGTMHEKTLHAVLKQTYAPAESHTEIKVGRYVADVFDGERIYEIQTASFRNLERKLDAFLPLYPVTVVYPMPHVRYLTWIDPDTGEATASHKGTKVGKPMDALQELWQIMRFLGHPNLTIELVLLDLDEYRFLNGWSKNRKSGSSRAERIPRSVAEVVTLHDREDYASLLPDFDAPFTAKDLQKKYRLSSRQSYSAIHVLQSLDFLREDGMRGRAVCYRVCDDPVR